MDTVFLDEMMPKKKRIRVQFNKYFTCSFYVTILSFYHSNSSTHFETLKKPPLEQIQSKRKIMIDIDLLLFCIHNPILLTSVRSETKLTI